MTKFTKAEFNKITKQDALNGAFEKYKDIYDKDTVEDEFRVEVISNALKYAERVFDNVPERYLPNGFKELIWAAQDAHRELRGNNTVRWDVHPTWWGWIDRDLARFGGTNPLNYEDYYGTGYSWKEKPKPGAHGFTNPKRK